MRVTTAIADRWFAPAPALRLGVARALIGGYAVTQLVRRMPRLTSFSHFDPEGFQPVGPVALLDAPLSDAMTLALPWVAVAIGLAFTAGAMFRLSGILFALLFTFVMAYRCSWGMVFHTESLVAIHLFVLAGSASSDAFSWDSRRRIVLEDEGEAYGWPLRLMVLLTALTYAVSATSKLYDSGFAWAEGEHLRNYVAFDALRKVELNSFHSPIGARLVGYPSLFTPMAVGALILELAGPLALLFRRLALLWVLLMWAFHVGVWLVMGIGFAYPLTGLAFAGLFRLEELLPASIRERMARKNPALRPTG